MPSRSGPGKQTAQLAAFAKAGNGSVVTATDAGGTHGRLRVGSPQRRDPAGRHRDRCPKGVEAGTSEMVAAALVGDVPITDTAVAVIGRGSRALRHVPRPPAYGPIAVAESETALFDRPWFLPAVLGLCSSHWPPSSPW